MGVSRNPAEMVRKIAHASAAIGDNRVAVERTAQAGKKVFKTARLAAGVTGTTKVTRSVKERYDMKGTPKNPTAIVRYTGPAHLINNPTQRHLIIAKRLGTLSTARSVVRGLGAVTAFGGTGVGMFGTLRGQSDFRREKFFNRETGKNSTRLRVISRQRSRSLLINGEHAAYAFHPGTPGKQFFQKAKPIYAKLAPEVYAQAGVREPLRRVFA